jgi:hypothetical protein
LACPVVSFVNTETPRLTYPLATLWPAELIVTCVRASFIPVLRAETIVTNYAITSKELTSLDYCHRCKQRLLWPGGKGVNFKLPRGAALDALAGVGIATHAVRSAFCMGSVYY